MDIKESLTVVSDASSVDRPAWIIPVAVGLPVFMLVLCIIFVLVLKKHRKKRRKKQR